MSDNTEAIRRVLVDEINSNPNERDSLVQMYGQVWNTEELSKEFSVEAFMAPFVIVTRKSDGKRGTLMFQHSPRYYFSFNPE